MNAGCANGGRHEKSNQQPPADEVRDERRRIAQLLHDTICQEITGIGLLITAVANQQRTASPALAQQLTEITEMIQHTSATVHEIMRGLQDKN